jgi:hypothetical protein
LDHAVDYTSSRRSVSAGAGDAPFHPLFGRDFEFVAHRQNWGEDRVHLHDENGVLFSLPAGWTDVAPLDPFVVVAEGRCPFTTSGLLVLPLVTRVRRVAGTTPATWSCSDGSPSLSALARKSLSRMLPGPSPSRAAQGVQRQRLRRSQ